MAAKKQHFAEAATTGVEALMHNIQKKEPPENAQICDETTQAEHITPPANQAEAPQKGLPLMPQLDGETPTEARVVQLLEDTFHTAGTDTIRIRLQDIAAYLNCTYMTVQRAKKQLEEKQKYRFERGNKCTVVTKL